MIGMSAEELKFVDDKLFVYTPLPQYGDGISKVQLVMTKEIFQECYKKWIESQESEDCISRQAAIDVVRKWFGKLQLNGDICLDEIISLPSVTLKAESEGNT